MKKFIQILNNIRKNKGRIVVKIIIIILLVGTVGNYKVSSDWIESFFKSITLLGLNVPDKINFCNAIGFVLAVILVYGGIFLLVFNNLLNNFLFKLFLKDKNIVLFGFGEINKSFLENFRKDRNDNVIVVDKEDKNFDEFWEEGYVFLKKEIDDKLIEKFDFEKTTDIIVALGNDRVNIDVALKLIDKLKDVKTETKLIVHVNDNEISDLFFEKLEKSAIEELKKQIRFTNKKSCYIVCTKSFLKLKIPQLLINLKIFSFYTEIVDDLFEKYATKLVPYKYAKLNSDKKELKVAIIGNSGVSVELIKRIFTNFIFPNKVQIKIFLIDKNEKEFYEKVEFETNYSKEKFPHIKLETKKLTYDLLKDKNFWLDKDLIDVFIAFENEDKNLEIAIDLFEKVYVHEDKKNLKYPNIFFAMYEELAFSKYIDNNKSNFKNFCTFGNMKDILNVKNLLDDEKFEIAMKIHNSWDKKRDMKKAWYATSYSNRLSSITQAEHIDFKLLSLGYKKVEKEKGKFDNTDDYKKELDRIKNFLKNDNFDEFLNSGIYYKLCDTEHRRWISFHFINNWEYKEFEGKNREEKEYYKSLKYHHCLTDFSKFKFDSIKDTFKYDFDSYYKIPEYLQDKYILKKMGGELI